MDPKLVEFFRTAAAKPFEWGEHDCGLWLADWYSTKTGKPDPAASLRGSYSGVRDCAAKYGNAAVARQTRAIMRFLSLPRVREFVPGDIAVLRFERVAIGAIRGSAGWVATSPHGLTRLEDSSVHVVAAWRIT